MGVLVELEYVKVLSVSPVAVRFKWCIFLHAFEAAICNSYNLLNGMTILNKFCNCYMMCSHANREGLPVINQKVRN